MSGGSTTVVITGPDAFSHPLANVSRSDRRAHVVGNSLFNNNWVIAPSSTAARDGLGPMFHARSCSGCHVRDGRGSPPAPGEVMTSLLIRLSVPGKDENGGPLGDPVYGTQLAVRAIPEAQPEGDVRIEYQEIPGTYADGTTYSLRRPRYTFIASGAYGAPNDKILIGPRLAPPVHGLGLLEAVPEAAILALADPEDMDSDGISGRPNRVWNPERKRHELGRFGWKANQPDIRQQTADAFRSDIGITSPIRPEEDFTDSQSALLSGLHTGGAPEISQELFDKVVRYQQTLAPPARRDWKEPEVLQGKELFHRIQCATCHTPTLHTAETWEEVPELSNQTIWPYTDLLLHDMGPELADDRPDFDATGNEWRTPPLWGIGLVATVNDHTYFLHDGRARNLEEAVLWHGGEAEASREAFKKLNQSERQALLKFLESL
ncbi:MAG: c-type cytochrome [Verrucomicrobiae bacterium]|nr:c-type cytochrome [Verrucomicrobiae bacterium]